MTIDEIQKIASAYDKMLKSTDKRFNNEVYVCHQDGSEFTLMHAFAVKYYEWVICFTEHCGFIIFHKDDVECIYYGEWKPLRIQSLRIRG